MTTILLVDDIPSHLKLGTLLLSDAGFDVRAADCAEAALASAREIRPDAILSDVVMNEMDGFGLCREVRGDTGLREIPVVLTSMVFQETGDTELAACVGANALVQTSADFSTEIAALLKGLEAGAPRRKLELGQPFERAHARRVSFQMTHLLERATRSECRSQIALESPVSERVVLASVRKAGETRCRNLLEHLPGVAWSTDSHGEITFATPNVEKLSGFTVEQVLAGGTAWWFSRVHADDRRSLFAEYLTLFAAADTTQTLAYRWKRKDGAWIWLQGVSTSIKNLAGGIAVDGVLDDVTPLRELEERLRQAKKMEAVGQLMGGLAHDFNNLLTVIMANASFLGEDLTPDDPRADAVTQIDFASKRAVGLTRQLLSFSRQEPRQMRVFAPAEALQHFCKMLSRLIGEDIELHLDLDPTASSLHMDVGQLEQVVMNLAINARDAMPEGGRLTIRLADVVLAATQRCATHDLPPGTYVLLSVTDTGHGMTPEVRQRIFEPFFTTKPSDRGTGLGLATVREIVCECGGAVSVTSELGAGTTFQVYLPCATAMPTTEAHVSEPTGLLTGNETVLLVEDDEAVAAVCRKMLEAAGYRVIGANNRASALKTIASSEPIDLVIADVVMPSGSGPEAAVALRVLRPDLKVLYMSGYTEHSALTAKRLAAPEDVLAKPFTATTLLMRVRHALRDQPA